MHVELLVAPRVSENVPCGHADAEEALEAREAFEK
jgi:hypothetical protein